MCELKQVFVLTEEICYTEFYERFLVKNQLCLLSESFTDSWPCRKLWVFDGKPNWEYLCETFGQAVAPVANCGESCFNSHSKTNWTVADYVIYLQKYISAGYPETMPCLYLKDWHMIKNFPDSSKLYQTPIYFSVDWLNEFWTLGDEDDYRFVYIGPKGSWTPFHADVYGSFSWSANIVGKKRWIFFPPGEELKLLSQLKITSLPYDLGKVDLQTLDISYYDLIQNAGEIVFVPSGWFHQVWNLEDTISINHNWFNGANVSYIHKALMKASAEVENELKSFGISELEETERETILNSHHGMNFQQFRQLLQTVAERRGQGFLKAHSSKSCYSCCSGKLCDETYHRSVDCQIASDLLSELKNNGNLALFVGI